MNKFQIALVVAILGSTGVAHASTVNVVLGSTGSDLSYSIGSNSISPNINLTAPDSGLVLDSNSQILSPPTSVTGQYLKPVGALYGDSYLAVKGIPSAGSATFTLTAGLNAFAFTWGTIDSYNTLKLTDTRNVTYTITGTDILNLLAGSVAGTTQSDVSFTTFFGNIAKAQLISTNNAFEAGNFSATDPAPVPLPAALPMFAVALLAGAFYMRRYKAN